MNLYTINHFRLDGEKAIYSSHPVSADSPESAAKVWNEYASHHPGYGIALGDGHETEIITAETSENPSPNIQWHGYAKIGFDDGLIGIQAWAEVWTTIVRTEEK
jgi:hypothetical protein